MKWFLLAACLSCSDPSPFEVAEVTEVDRDGCALLAELALANARAFMPPGSVAAAWCVADDDWRDVDAYPQRRR